MKGVEAALAGLLVLSAVTATTAHAQTAVGPPPRYCCLARAGTVVEVELAAQVSTKAQKPGDTVPLRLAAPLVVDDRVVLERGAPGYAVVIQSSKPGMGGKSAKLVLAGRYLILPNGARAPLQGLQLSAAGHDNTMSAEVIGLSGFAFAPLGFVGLAVPGGNVVFPPGTRATAKLAADTFLPALGWAPRYPARYGPADDFEGVPPDGSSPIPPPPPGQGEVVFFRKKSLLGVGQWFNVRERGAALGRLGNGAYFVQVADPGLHTYTAKTEPEVSDRLTLEVDPGEVYFVEGTLTKGVVIGEADLAPSDHRTFARDFDGLKLASRPAEGANPPEADAAPGGGAGGRAKAVDAVPQMAP